MKALKNSLAAAVAALGLSFGSVGAHAALVLTIDDLSTAGVDWSSGPQPSGTPLSFVGAVGSWSFSSVAGLGDGWSDIFGIHLNSFSASSSAGGTLRVSFTETDLTNGLNGGPTYVSSGIGGLTQGTVAYQTWIDDANNPFGLGQALFSGTGTGAFSAAGGAVTSASDPFSLTLIVDITHSGARTTSVDFGASIPEPGTMALLGAALLGMGAAGRRRKAAKAAV